MGLDVVDSTGGPRQDGPSTHVEHLRDLSRKLEVPPGLPEGPARDYLIVTLESGRTGRLDLSLHRSAVWTEVLESLRESGQPVYLQIDPDSGFVTELLQPRLYAVLAIREVPDGIDVELEVSHAIHHVRSSNPDFDAMRRSLQSALELRAPMLITDALNGREIIDVRPPVRRVEAPA